MIRILFNKVREFLFGLAFNMKDLRYRKWVEDNSLTPESIDTMKKEIDAFEFQPKISVVMPVYDIKQEWLEDAIDSVLNQVYENWELCIADDASPSPHIRVVLEKYLALDKRIKVRFLEKNQGMSGSSNTALSLATGSYIALLDHDDVLSGDSLFETVKLLNSHRDAGIIYSNEDKLTMGGRRMRPVYKTGWDPELFLTYNYFCHLVVLSTELIKKAGGFRKGYEGSQDYDLLLRVTELSDKIYHIPKILYHWRMVPGSAAMVVDAKREAFNKSKQALKDAMQRRGIEAEVTDGKRIGTFKVKPVKR